MDHCALLGWWALCKYRNTNIFVFRGGFFVFVVDAEHEISFYLILELYLPINMLKTLRIFSQTLSNHGHILCQTCSPRLTHLYPHSFAHIYLPSLETTRTIRTHISPLNPIHINLSRWQIRPLITNGNHISMLHCFFIWIISDECCCIIVV